MPRSVLLSLLLAGFIAPAATGCSSVEKLFGVERKDDPPDPDAGPMGDGDGDGDGDADASVDPGDAGFGDASLGEPDVLDCEVDDRSGWDDVIEFGDETSFALTTGATGFGLAYRPALSGECEQIYATAVSSTGAFPLPPPVVGNDDCNVIRDLSLGFADNWWLAWVDNRTGSTELHAQQFDEALEAPTDAPMQLTDELLGAERNVVLAGIAGRPAAAWITEHLDDDTFSIHTRMLDEGSGTAILDRDTEHSPTKLAFAQIGDDAAAVAWVNEVGKPGVWLRPLDADARPTAEPVALSNFAYSGATVDIATRQSGNDVRRGGAAVYSISVDGGGREVRYRRLDKDGNPDGLERTIIGGNLKGIDASIARLAGGYAVSYRALPGGNVETPEIRIMFVTRDGDTVRDEFGRPLSYHLADASMAEARTTLRVSRDGQILVAWMDRTADGATVLKLSRRRLDCN